MKKYTLLLLLFTFTISIFSQSSCGDVSPISSFVLGSTSADLIWISGDPNHIDYNIEWGQSGFTQGSGTSISPSPTSSPYTLTGLSPNTTYDFYAQANCGISTLGLPDLSNWDGPHTFTTYPVCVAPTSLGATPTTSTASLSWVAGGTETDWELEWGPSGYTQGQGTMISGGISVTPSYNLTGLTHSTSYDFYVAAQCGSNPQVSWSGPYTFTTLTCTNPTNLTSSNVTPTSANISWVAGGSESQWNVEYGLSGFSQGQGTFSTGTFNNPKFITGLTSNTSYDVYVQADCDGQNSGSLSGWIGPYTFTTLCDAPTNLNVSNISYVSADLSWNPGSNETQWNIQWDTASFILGNGTIVNTSLNPYSLTGINSNTNYEFYVQAVCGSNNSSDWIGPFIFTTSYCNDPTPISSYVLGSTSADLVWVASNFVIDYNIEWGQSGFTQGSGTSISPSPTISPYTLTGLSPNTSYDFYVQSNCGEATNTNPWFLHTFTTYPVCVAPTSLGATPTTSTASLSWVAGGTETDWELEWGPSGYTQGQGTMISGGISVTPSYNLTGLTHSTSYDFYVAAQCGSNPQVSWSGPYTFTTLTCTNPTNLTASNVGALWTDITWIAGGSESNWNIEWGTVGFTPGMGSGTVSGVINTPTHGFNVTPNTSYDVYVQADCDGLNSVNLSGWVGPLTFTSLCESPSTLGATNITPISADLLWIAGGSETQWNIQWDTVNFIIGNGATVNTSSNPYTLTGLNTDTQYEFYVQAVCSSNLNGEWVGPYSFTTLDVTDMNNYNDIYFKIYPNPNKGNFNIVINHSIQNSEIIITDIQGKVLLKNKKNFDKNIPININLPSIAKGIYFVEMKHNGKSWIEQITINY